MTGEVMQSANTIYSSAKRKRFGCCRNNECSLYATICPIGKKIVLQGFCDREKERGCTGNLGR